jgi:hypothetical protein
VPRTRKRIIELLESATAAAVNNNDGKSASSCLAIFVSAA